VRRDTITIVLVSENREPFTIEFSIKELVLIVVVLLTLTGAAVFSMVSFRKLKAQHAELTSSVQMLKEDLSKREGYISELKSKLDAQKELTLLIGANNDTCLLYTSPSPRDRTRSRMPSSA